MEDPPGDADCGECDGKTEFSDRPCDMDKDRTASCAGSDTESRQAALGAGAEQPSETTEYYIKARPLHSILDSFSRRKSRVSPYLKSRLSKDGSMPWIGGAKTNAPFSNSKFHVSEAQLSMDVDPALAANGVAEDFPLSAADVGIDDPDALPAPCRDPSVSIAQRGLLLPTAISVRRDEQLQRDLPRHGTPPIEPVRATAAAAVRAAATAVANVKIAAATGQHASGAELNRAGMASAMTSSKRSIATPPPADSPTSKAEAMSLVQQHQQAAAAANGAGQLPGTGLVGGVGGSGDVLFTCEHCGIQLPRARDLNRHMLSHTRLHVCSHCGHRSSSSYNLRVHIRTHTGERPHACTECGQTFTQTCSLKRHALMHAAERVQTCRVCQKQFLPGLPLSKHMLKHIGEKTFICEQCDSLEEPPPPTPQARARARAMSAAAGRRLGSRGVGSAAATAASSAGAETL